MSGLLQFLVSFTLICHVMVNGFSQSKPVTRYHHRLSMLADFQPGDADILVRAFRGEDVERTPVWLMRQVSAVSSTKHKPND